MKHYLHKFANQAAYNTAKAGADFYLPAVSLIENGMGVIYDSLPVVPDGFVDFGLPSGTLWAQYNLGVDPTDLDSAADWYGDYYAWGETTQKSVDFVNETCSPSCDWEHYTHANGASNKLIKYCSNSKNGDNGFVDNLTHLVSIDDAATQFNSTWNIPTTDQFSELQAATINSFETNYQGIIGLNGRLYCKAIVTQQPFKNITLYSPLFEPEGESGGEITQEHWDFLSLSTLDELNNMVKGMGVDDFRTIVFKDAEWTTPAIYGSEYAFCEKQVDSTISIFIPMNGRCADSHWYQYDVSDLEKRPLGYYWTSECDEDSSSAMRVEVNTSRLDIGYSNGENRCEGMGVRPVITPAY